MAFPLWMALAIALMEGGEKNLTIDAPIFFLAGLYTSTTHNESLCDETNFLARSWVTQGRVEISEPTPYPIIGEYTGVIPDTDGFCAKLYSDCNNPEIMFYTIFNCFNRSEVYEEREYRCLGEWMEDGLIYTYVERRDMIGHECFVGLVTAKGNIYLKEAGTNCERGQEPLKNGMRMTQVSKCYGGRPPRRPHRRRGGGSARPPTTGPPQRTATALPTWRERELTNLVASALGGGSAGVIVSRTCLAVSVVFIWAVHALAS